MTKKQIRETIYNKYGGKCAYCGEDIVPKNMQVDHCIPKDTFYVHVKNKWKVPKHLNHLCENDMNHHDNLMPSCRVCNNWKHSHDLELFRSELQAQIERLNNRSSNFRIAKKYGLVIENIKPVIFYFEQPLSEQGGNEGK